MIKKLLYTLFFLVFFSTPVLAQKVFMTGDSHVAGKIYPKKVGEILQQEVPDLEFDFWGKSGAGFYTFNKSPEYMKILFDANPDILIVHLGTNDSYANVFKEDYFNSNLATFFDNFHSKLPECKIVFVTPFYNKHKDNKTKQWKLNTNTRLCSDDFINFAYEHPDVVYVVDNNAEYGMDYVESPKYIRNDFVHLTVEGYELLGEDVAWGLLEFSDLFNTSQPSNVNEKTTVVEENDDDDYVEAETVEDPADDDDEDDGDAVDDDSEDEDDGDAVDDDSEDEEDGDAVDEDSDDEDDEDAVDEDSDDEDDEDAVDEDSDDEDDEDAVDEDSDDEDEDDEGDDDSEEEDDEDSDEEEQ